MERLKERRDLTIGTIRSKKFLTGQVDNINKRYSPTGRAISGDSRLQLKIISVPELCLCECPSKNLSFYRLFA